MRNHLNPIYISMKYKEEKRMIECGESAGYRIGNSDYFLIYVFQTKEQKYNREILIVNPEYEDKKLSFNLG